MSELKAKVLREMKVGAKVVVATYPFPEWEPDIHYKNVYLYTIGSAASRRENSRAQLQRQTPS
jgi:hypothetical protein